MVFSFPVLASTASELPEPYRSLLFVLIVSVMVLFVRALALDSDAESTGDSGIRVTRWDSPPEGERSHRM